ncbi:hypothetical protein NE865_03402 [Phthorimaea operculella]|nr:hypothetical protein NE865_03402 [Phthorimaea operculella]
MLTALLEHKIEIKLSPQKKIIYDRSMQHKFIQTLFYDSNIVKRKIKSHYCWFELMQIYDKFADCLFYFNQIYAGQVFLMFNSWILCTLLLICRSLSPSVKYSEVFMSDIFVYFVINGRPIVLARLCELIRNEKRRTQRILLDCLVNDIDTAYTDQIRTMVDLVETRKVEISGYVFTADIATVMDFAGRTLTYTVIMIQSFYIRMFYKNYLQ